AAVGGEADTRAVAPGRVELADRDVRRPDDRDRATVAAVGRGAPGLVAARRRDQTRVDAAALEDDLTTGRPGLPTVGPGREDLPADHERAGRRRGDVRARVGEVLRRRRTAGVEVAEHAQRAARGDRDRPREAGAVVDACAAAGVDGADPDVVAGDRD